MSSHQLVFDFGRSVMRHLQLLPDEPRHPRKTSTKPHERDQALEALSHRLLRQAGCPNLSIRVAWNPRLRTTAGIANWNTRTITLNPRLRKISPKEVQRTLRHELAHFLAQYRAGRRRIQAHGPEWRDACRALGIPREPRCHDLPFERRKIPPRFFYACRHCGKTLARVRAIRRPMACLACCKKFNNGRYDERFRFLEIPEPGRRAA
jgi:SprT protein